jgi:hypothetical protein
MSGAPRWRTYTTPPGNALCSIASCIAPATAAASAGGITGVGTTLGAAVGTGVAVAGGGVLVGVGGALVGVGGAVGLAGAAVGSAVGGGETMDGVGGGLAGCATQPARSEVAPAPNSLKTSRRRCGIPDHTLHERVSGRTRLTPFDTADYASQCHGRARACRGRPRCPGPRLATCTYQGSRLQLLGGRDHLDTWLPVAVVFSGAPVLIDSPHQCLRVESGSVASLPYSSS